MAVVSYVTPVAASLISLPYHTQRMELLPRSWGFLVPLNDCAETKCPSIPLEEFEGKTTRHRLEVRFGRRGFVDCEFSHRARLHSADSALGHRRLRARPLFQLDHPALRDQRYHPRVRIDQDGPLPSHPSESNRGRRESRRFRLSQGRLMGYDTRCIA